MGLTSGRALETLELDKQDSSAANAGLDVCIWDLLHGEIGRRG